MDTFATPRGSLIKASQVQGANVYSPHGERLGSIEDVTLDKRSGKAVYAILSFDDILGFGGDDFTIAWSKLKYDSNLGGYVVDIESRVIEGVPAYAAGAAPYWTYEDVRRRVYGSPLYWGDSGD
ncbi:MAG: PRC-barrel domain-containing protein [Pseudomonadota bacterium]|nr:PRC-barrel domain-containing protein [Pseudomonadota bacterium]